LGNNSGCMLLVWDILNNFSFAVIRNVHPLGQQC
jgi:hypothetical protein